jgi:hypothetical protein
MNNFALSADRHVDHHRGLAERARGEQPSGWSRYDQANMAEAAAQDRAAKRWSDRAAAAREGTLLVHDGDYHFALTHQHLINHAESQRRCRHEPMDDLAPAKPNL